MHVFPAVRSPPAHCEDRRSGAGRALCSLPLLWPWFQIAPLGVESTVGGPPGPAATQTAQHRDGGRSPRPVPWAGGFLAPHTARVEGIKPCLQLGLLLRVGFQATWLFVFSGLEYAFPGVRRKPTKAVQRRMPSVYTAGQGWGKEVGCCPVWCYALIRDTWL